MTSLQTIKNKWNQLLSSNITVEELIILFGDFLKQQPEEKDERPQTTTKR